MASMSVRGGTHHPSRSKRMPLAELPLHSFVDRPPSPIKSYSSPSKLHTTALRATTHATSTSSSSSSSSEPAPLYRTNSAPVDSPNKSTSSLFREVIRNIDAPDMPLETGTAIKITKGKGRARPIFASPKAAQSPSPISISSSERALASPSQQQEQRPVAVSFSPKKRVLPSAARSRELNTQNRRQLLDEDEEGDSTPEDILTGPTSPNRPVSLPFASPMEVKKSRPATFHDGQINMPKLNPEGVKWSVWHDECAIQEALMEVFAAPTGNDDDADSDGKENIALIAPGNAATSRKKGTGGRLSLLATANESSDLELSCEASGKRRRTVADPA